MAGPAAQVSAVLQGYADRGLFQGFVEDAKQPYEARFLWLNEQPITVAWDGREKVTVKALLPDMPARSMLYRDVKTFLAARQDEALPEHRRIDPARAIVECVNRKGSVSISLRVKGGDYPYATAKLVALTHELFIHLNEFWPDYMCESFGASPE